MHRAALVLLPSCSLADVSMLLQAIQHRAWRLRVVAPQNEPVVTAEGLKVIPDISMQEAVPLHYRLLIIPGGPFAQDVYQDAQLQRFLRQYDGTRNLIATSCEGIVCLGAAGLVGGICYSSPPTIKTRYAHFLRHAIYQSQPVTADANIVSSDGSASTLFVSQVCQRLDLFF